MVVFYLRDDEVLNSIDALGIERKEWVEMDNGKLIGC